MDELMKCQRKKRKNIKAYESRKHNGKRSKRQETRRDGNVIDYRVGDFSYMWLSSNCHSSSASLMSHIAPEESRI